jgi:hypothetical protein
LAAVCTGCGATSGILVPHFVQNFEFEVISAPHPGQILLGTGASALTAVTLAAAASTLLPQWTQNLLPSLISAPHLVQIISLPPRQHTYNVLYLFF